MNLEFLSVSALLQTHTPFDFLFHSFCQQVSFSVTVCQKSFKKSESVDYFRSPLGTVGGDFFHEHGMSFWERSRGWRCSITAQRIKYSSGEGYQTAHRCFSISRQLSFPDNYLFERHRFTSQSIIYIHNLIRPYICNITNRSHALTSQQILCVALRFFANWSFLYNVGDAEHLSKATVCRAVRKVCLALKRLLPMFVVFPGHKPVRAIKEVLGGGWTQRMSSLQGFPQPLAFQYCGLGLLCLR